VGATLVKRVIEDWSHLPHTQWRALVVMANTALDEPTAKHPAAVYWRGHGYLALALGYQYPPGETQAAMKTRRNSRKQVGTNVDGLTDAGAIEIVWSDRAVRLGHAQAYHLLLGGGAPRPPTWGGTTPPRGGAPHPPQE
jgi:hypothetical protein